MLKRMQNPQKGASLIEVLVAILILSIGMLGMAGLQAATAKFQQGSRVKGAIAVLLSDKTSRVRSNPDMTGNNAVTGATSVSAYALDATWNTLQAATLTVSTDCETGSTTCTTAERATYDMTSWRQRVRASMPGGAALLTGDRATGFTVTFMWFDKENTTKGQAIDTALSAAQVCTTTAEVAGINRMSQQNCCPASADVPAGVRCARYGFTP